MSREVALQRIIKVLKRAYPDYRFVNGLAEMPNIIVLKPEESEP